VKLGDMTCRVPVAAELHRALSVLQSTGRPEHGAETTGQSGTWAPGLSAVATGAKLLAPVAKRGNLAAISPRVPAPNGSVIYPSRSSPR